MHSKRTLEKLAGLHPRARFLFEAFILAAYQLGEKEGIQVQVISGLRTYAQQNALYAQGRTTRGPIVTNAKAGQSWHNFGLAIDLGLFKGGKYLDDAAPRAADAFYKKLGALASTHGIEWAGNWTTFQETPHFQITFGLTLARARALLKDAGGNATKIKLPA